MGSLFAGLPVALTGRVVAVPDGFGGSTTNFLDTVGALNTSFFYRERLVP